MDHRLALTGAILGAVAGTVLGCHVDSLAVDDPDTIPAKGPCAPMSLEGLALAGGPMVAAPFWRDSTPASLLWGSNLVPAWRALDLAGRPVGMSVSLAWDTSWSPNATADLSALAVQPNDGLLVAGFDPDSPPWGMFLDFTQDGALADSYSVADDSTCAHPYLVPYDGGFIASATCYSYPVEPPTIWARLWPLNFQGEPTGSPIDLFQVVDPTVGFAAPLAAFEGGARIIVAADRSGAVDGVPGVLELAGIDPAGVSLNEVDLAEPFFPLSAAALGDDLLLLGWGSDDGAGGAPVVLARVLPTLQLGLSMRFADRASYCVPPLGGSCDVGPEDSLAIAVSGETVVAAWADLDTSEVTIVALNGDLLDEECRWSVPSAYAPRLAGGAEGVLFTTGRRSGEFGLQAAILRF